MRKTINNTFAIHAAVPAMTAKPKIAAITAITRNMIAQYRMTHLLARVLFIPNIGMNATMSTVRKTPE